MSFALLSQKICDSLFLSIDSYTYYYTNHPPITDRQMELEKIEKDAFQAR